MADQTVEPTAVAAEPGRRIGPPAGADPSRSDPSRSDPPRLARPRALGAAVPALLEGDATAGCSALTRRCAADGIAGRPEQFCSDHHRPRPPDRVRARRDVQRIPIANHRYVTSPCRQSLSGGYKRCVVHLGGQLSGIGSGTGWTVRRRRCWWR